MKKFFLTSFLLFVTAFTSAQWTNVINPQFTIHNECRLNTFVDANGVHIVYWKNGGIKYARLNSAGNVLYYDKVIEPEGSNCDFVNIVSVDNNQLYAIYKKNNTINVALSVNLGNNWTNNYDSRLMSNSGCDKIVAYNDGDVIHIGWTEFQSGSSYYRDVWYVQFKPNTSPSWSGLFNLTPDNYTGSDPDMTISPNKIHYTYFSEDYGTSWSNPISRDKIKTAGWENPMNISSIGVPAKYKKPVIANNEVNSVLREVPCSFIMCNSYITHSDRPYNQGFWNDYELIRETDLNYPMEVESTVDNKIHFIYFDKLDNVWEHRYLLGSTLSGSIAQVNLLANPEHLLVSNSNDLYLLALGSSIIPTYPVFQHYDVAPLAPQNYAVSVYQSGSNRYPKLDWSLNTELDVRNKTTNAYKIERRTRIASSEWSNWSNWSTLANLAGSVSSYIDYSINTAGSGNQEAEYKITAVDLGNNASPPQSVVLAFGTVLSDKISEQNIATEYILAQNYPNPFNPSTNISYSIKEKGFVSLRIFDLLGREVAELINELKEAGNYTIEFNANNLPSGIYIYSIRVNDFMQTCKMSLLK
jgi:hypothetical protein